MLIVDTSGHDKEFEQRILAIEKMAQAHPDLPIQIVLPKKSISPLPQFPENTTLVTSSQTIRKSIELLRIEKQAVLVTAGNTGRFVAQAIKEIGLLHPKIQPVLVAEHPKTCGRFVLVDAGSTLWPTPEVIGWAALAGNTAATSLFQKIPIIGLLNIGEEAGKGGRELEECRLLLADIFKKQFMGNIEFNNLVNSNVDVLVTSGFLGNLALKAGEGMLGMQKRKIKNACQRNPLLWPLALLFERLSKIFWADLDWRNFAGAYLLGIKKPIIITHGRSDAAAFLTALEHAQHPNCLDIYARIKQDPLIEKWLSTLES